MSSFQDFMVDALATQVDLTGKAVLELAADPQFMSARAFKRHGAGAVISSDLEDVWYGAGEPGVVTARIDARDIQRALPDRSVDVVYAINALEHFPDLPAVLASIARVVRPGGIVLLHGHPLWTSARGHHALVGDPSGWRVHFGEPNDPVPPWGHLTLSPEAMRPHLAHLDPDTAAAVLDWCYASPLITRTPRRQILAAVEAGPLTMRHLWEDRLEPPSPADLERIRQSRWWDPDEDYGVRALTVILEA